MPNGNDKIGNTVGLVALGGVTDVALMYAATKVSKQGVDVGKVNLNVAMATGALTSLAEIGAGMATKHKGLTLVGAGSLAATLAVVVGNALMAYNPLNASAVARNSANPTYAGLDNPQPSPFAPVAQPQQALLVGNAGGGGPSIVYKDVQDSPFSEPTNPNKPQLFV